MCARREQMSELTTIVRPLIVAPLLLVFQESRIFSILLSTSLIWFSSPVLESSMCMLVPRNLIWLVGFSEKCWVKSLMISWSISLLSATTVFSGLQIRPETLVNSSMAFTNAIASSAEDDLAM